MCHKHRSLHGCINKLTKLNPIKTKIISTKTVTKKSTYPSHQPQTNQLTNWWTKRWTDKWTNKLTDGRLKGHFKWWNWQPVAEEITEVWIYIIYIWNSEKFGSLFLGKKHDMIQSKDLRLLWTTWQKHMININYSLKRSVFLIHHCIIIHFACYTLLARFCGQQVNESRSGLVPLIYVQILAQVTKSTITFYMYVPNPRAKILNITTKFIPKTKKTTTKKNYRKMATMWQYKLPFQKLVLCPSPSTRTGTVATAVAAGTTAVATTTAQATTT